MGQPTFIKPATKLWLTWMSYSPSEEQHCVEAWMKRLFLCGKRKPFIRVYNHEREDEVCSIYLGLMIQIWVNPINFHGTTWLQSRSIPDQSLIKRKFSWEFTFLKIIQLDIFTINASSSLSCSAFYVRANFNPWFYSSLRHKAFSISSWILLHNVFFVHWKARELAPCEPVEFIKPANTKLSWLPLWK